MKNTNLFKATCPHDCPDACSMEVEIDEVTKKVMKVSGEKSHPVTKGFLCNKVNNYIDLIYNKDRVLYPKIRVNSKQEKQAKWKRISWEDAIDIISRKLDHTLKEYGPNSILPYSYSGTLGLVGFLGLGEAFFNKLGAIKLLRTICTAAGEEADGEPNATARVERQHARVEVTASCLDEIRQHAVGGQELARPAHAGQ